MRLYLNETYLGEQKVELAAGKNLFTFPQTLNEAGFYKYDAQIEAPRTPSRKTITPPPLPPCGATRGC